MFTKGMGQNMKILGWGGSVTRLCGVARAMSARSAGGANSYAAHCACSVGGRTHAKVNPGTYNGDLRYNIAK